MFNFLSCHWANVNTPLFDFFHSYTASAKERIPGFKGRVNIVMFTMAGIALGVGATGLRYLGYLA